MDFLYWQSFYKITHFSASDGVVQLWIHRTVEWGIAIVHLSAEQKILQEFVLDDRMFRCKCDQYKDVQNDEEKQGACANQRKKALWCQIYLP